MYDPCWHPAIEKFQQSLKHPSHVPIVKRFAEQMHDDFFKRRIAEPEFWQRLETFRAYEDDPTRRNGIDPLLIDSNLVEIRAILKYARPETSGWLAFYEDQFLQIAMRTKHWRQALLTVQSPPTLDLC